MKITLLIQDEEFLYFIFENCPNGTLNDIIGAKGKLTEEIVKIYAAQLINVIQVFQEHGIMHRDLKPQNILISNEWNIKVVRSQHQMSSNLNCID